MRLISLNSNLTSFKQIKFKNGLNVIVGERTNPEVKDTKDSYNGVGKSLIIEIIHFCLGSKKIKAFSENIPEAEFYLTFETQNHDVHVIKRECSGDQVVYLDEEKYESITLFTNKLEKLIFPNLPNQKGLSFRSLISRFMRRYKSSYNKYYNYVKKEQPYNELITNSYLLGLDTEIVEKKMSVKNIASTLNKAKKSLKEDKLLLEYFKGNKDIKFQITELKEQKTKLEQNISNFKVADNYNEMKSNADQLSKEKSKLNNELFFVERNIEKIEKMSNVEITLKADDLEEMYKEAKFLFPNDVKKTLYEVTDFHEKIIENRKLVYNKQLDQLKKRRVELENTIKDLSNKLDNLMAFLNQHGALNEFAALNEKYRKVTEQFNKLSDYNKLIKDYEYELSIKKKEKEDIKIEIKTYLDMSTKTQDNLMKQFRFFSKQFYKDKASGLSVNGNYKDNQISWEIHADIEDDSSDGVNEVLIYCFDLTMFSIGRHDVSFLFHDSRLFSNMDPRQRFTALKIAIDFTNNNPNYQYILSLNEDMIESIKPMIDENEFESLKDYINKSRVLTLKDDKPENKLLGFQKNIPYDK